MYSEVNEMTNMIVIAELTKGNVNPSTAELVSAATVSYTHLTLPTILLV